MNTTTLDAQRSFTWRDIQPTSLNHVRTMLLLKHGSLTQAAVSLKMAYPRLSHAIAGRDLTIRIIAAIQTDLGLSNHQVLTLWPLLREWPKEGRRAA